MKHAQPLKGNLYELVLSGQMTPFIDLHKSPSFSMKFLCEISQIWARFEQENVIPF